MGAIREEIEHDANKRTHTQGAHVHAHAHAHAHARHTWKSKHSQTP